MSNEPGYYQEGDEGFGIRIENLVVVVEATEVEARRKKRLSHAPAAEQSHGGFLQFERLTMVPIQKSLVVAPLAEGGWQMSYWLTSTVLTISYGFLVGAYLYSTRYVCRLRISDRAPPPPPPRRPRRPSRCCPILRRRRG